MALEVMEFLEESTKMKQELDSSLFVHEFYSYITYLFVYLPGRQPLYSCT